MTSAPLQINGAAVKCQRRVLLQTIRDLKMIPRVELFAAARCLMSEAEFDAAILSLISLAVVEETDSGVLRWLGN